VALGCGEGCGEDHGEALLLAFRGQRGERCMGCVALPRSSSSPSPPFCGLPAPPPRELMAVFGKSWRE
jgi:hypothetical protein